MFPGILGHSARQPLRGGGEAKDEKGGVRAPMLHAEYRRGAAQHHGFQHLTILGVHYQTCVTMPPSKGVGGEGEENISLLKWRECRIGLLCQILLPCDEAEGAAEDLSLAGQGVMRTGLEQGGEREKKGGGQEEG